jgi:hypothetical protein
MGLLDYSMPRGRVAPGPAEFLPLGSRGLHQQRTRKRAHRGRFR